MKPSLQIRLLVFITLAFALTLELTQGSIVPPDVQVSITRVDPVGGKTVWSYPFERALRPYRCEAYTNRIVVFLYRANADHNFENTEVAYLDAKTGKKVKPFDTRHFIWSDDDPEIARSRYGSQGSVEEERCEISLPNGWRSHGVAGLSWRNAGSNNIYFFCGSTLTWSMILPEGAYNLSHWKDILIFRRNTEEGNRIIDRLHAQPAGQNSTSWVFALPEDLPDRKWGGADFISDKTYRGFSHTVGKNAIFAFGGGTLFALDPRTGRLLWRHSVSGDPAVKNRDVFMDNAEIIEGEDRLILVSGNAMIGFDRRSESPMTVLRKDLYDGPSPVFVAGSVYCFTQRP